MLARRLAVNPADAQLLTNYAHLLEAAEDIPGHALGQVDEGVIVTDVDLADVLTLQARLIGDRADDVARLHAVRVPDLETESLERDVTILATPPPMPRTALASQPVAVLAGFPLLVGTVAGISLRVGAAAVLASRALETVLRMRARIGTISAGAVAGISVRVRAAAVLASWALTETVLRMRARIGTISAGAVDVFAASVRWSAVVSIAVAAAAIIAVAAIVVGTGTPAIVAEAAARGAVVAAVAVTRIVDRPTSCFRLWALWQQQGC